MNLEQLQKRIQVAIAELQPCSQKLDGVLLQAIQGNSQPDAYRLEKLRELAQSYEGLHRLTRRLCAVYEYEVSLLSAYETHADLSLAPDKTDSGQSLSTSTPAPGY